MTVRKQEIERRSASSGSTTARPPLSTNVYLCLKSAIECLSKGSSPAVVDRPPEVGNFVVRTSSPVLWKCSSSRTSWRGKLNSREIQGGVATSKARLVGVIANRLMGLAHFASRAQCTTFIVDKWISQSSVEPTSRSSKTLMRTGFSTKDSRTRSVITSGKWTTFGDWLGERLVVIGGFCAHSTLRKNSPWPLKGKSPTIKLLNSTVCVATPAAAAAVLTKFALYKSFGQQGSRVKQRVQSCRHQPQHWQQQNHTKSEKVP
mmetsp:Transcript_57977/g.168171  ORF Transcript_57977/g.168171 Transcript_57977/m.168171 type:complete len:261 (+) Transcript_57977:671-1453(+)